MNTFNPPRHIHLHRPLVPGLLPRRLLLTSEAGGLRGRLTPGAQDPPVQGPASRSRAHSGRGCPWSRSQVSPPPWLWASLV